MKLENIVCRIQNKERWQRTRSMYGEFRKIAMRTKRPIVTARQGEPEITPEDLVESFRKANIPDIVITMKGPDDKWKEVME